LKGSLNFFSPPFSPLLNFPFFKRFSLFFCSFLFFGEEKKKKRGGILKGKVSGGRGSNGKEKGELVYKKVRRFNKNCLLFNKMAFKTKTIFKSHK
jgi:hypothetical protein